MKQKFPRGTFVQITKDLPTYMRHFEKDFVGVIEYSYKQEYGYGSTKSYSIVQLDKKGSPINTIAWYEEDQLTLVSSDVKKGKAIIEAYHYHD